MHAKVLRSRKHKLENSMFSTINTSISSKASCKDSKHGNPQTTSSFYTHQQFAIICHHILFTSTKRHSTRGYYLSNHLSCLISIFIFLPTKNISLFDFTSLPSFEHQEKQSCLTKLRVEWNFILNKEHIGKLQVNNLALGLRHYLLFKEV